MEGADYIFSAAVQLEPYAQRLYPMAHGWKLIFGWLAIPVTPVTRYL